MFLYRHDLWHHWKVSRISLSIVIIIVSRLGPPIYLDSMYTFIVQSLHKHRHCLDCPFAFSRIKSSSHDSLLYTYVSPIALCWITYSTAVCIHISVNDWICEFQGWKNSASTGREQLLSLYSFLVLTSHILHTRQATTENVSLLIHNTQRERERKRGKGGKEKKKKQVSQWLFN